MFKEGNNTTLESTFLFQENVGNILSRVIWKYLTVAQCKQQKEGYLLMFCFGLFVLYLKNVLTQNG